MTIMVKSEDYAKFLRIRAASAALDRKAKALREGFGLPEATAENIGGHVIVDGNKIPVGKFTVAARAGYEVKPGFVGKLS